MSEATTFRDFLRLVRAGDARAAEQLVQRYQRAIRLAVRARLTDPRLRRLLDSMDICQSVLASFFVRAAAGQYDLEQSEQLLHLLETMAYNKLIKESEKQQAARRDYRRQHPGAVEEQQVADPGLGPSTVVSHAELLRKARERLTPEERRLADLRTLGRSWAAIAAEVGGTPDALRMQFTRALDRVTSQLGLDS